MNFVLFQPLQVLIGCSPTYSELPIKFNGQCSMIYLLSAMRTQSYFWPPVTGKPVAILHIIVVHRPSNDKSHIFLDALSACGPVNCNKIECTWYKNREIHTVADKETYKMPDNARLYANDASALLPTDKRYQSFFEAAERFEHVLTPRRMVDIKFYLDIDLIHLLLTLMG